jgi:hypothetical protein
MEELVRVPKKRATNKNQITEVLKKHPYHKRFFKPMQEKFYFFLCFFLLIRASFKEAAIA